MAICFVHFVYSRKCDSSRAATALHRTLDVRHIAAKSFFLFLVPTPGFFEGVEGHLHDSLEDVTLALLFHSVDQLIKNP